MVKTYDYGPGYPVPRVMLVSPILIGNGVENSPFSGFSAGAAAASRQLAPLYRAQAEAHGWLYLDAASVASPSDLDQLHLEACGHHALAEAVEAVIRKYF